MYCKLDGRAEYIIPCSVLCRRLVPILLDFNTYDRARDAADVVQSRELRHPIWAFSLAGGQCYVKELAGQTIGVLWRRIICIRNLFR